MGVDPKLTEAKKVPPELCKPQQTLATDGITDLADIQN